jgi:predicted XRE-type DNA-binding protein
MSEEITPGSGNVFADLGLAGADERQARAELLRTITGIIDERRLTQAQAADTLGTTQPVVSDIKRGKLHRFSLERLIGFLNALDRDVEIVVLPKPMGRGAHLTVAAD